MEVNINVATPSTSKSDEPARSTLIHNQPTQTKPEPFMDGTTQKVVPKPNLGSWTLNKNKLKELGIESSVLSALNKLKANNGKQFLQVNLFE